MSRRSPASLSDGINNLASPDRAIAHVSKPPSEVCQRPEEKLSEADFGSRSQNRWNGFSEVFGILLPSAYSPYLYLFAFASSPSPFLLRFLILL